MLRFRLNFGNVLNPSDGPISYSFLGGAMGSEKADYLSELWGRYYDESWFGTGDHSSDENRYAEAFGSAVWEIIYEALPGSAADWDVTRDGTSGELGFRAEGLDSLTANRWLHSLNGYGPKANLVALSYCGAQDFLVESPIPEPATVALLGFGLLFICRRAKVRHSK